MARWHNGPACLPSGPRLLPAHIWKTLTPLWGQLAAVLCAWAGLAVLQLLWLAADQRPLAWDQSHHFLLALRYLEALRSPLTWPDIFSVAIKYPYLFHLSLAKLFLITGPSLRFAAAINLFWLLALMLALWHLGRRVFGGWAGVWAAGLCAAAPVTAGLGRQVLLETCLAAVIAWTVLALWESRGLSRRGWVLALGVLAGLGLLAKWTYPLYVAAPWFIAWRQGRGEEAGRDGRGLWLALVICLALALPWYLHSPVTLFKILLGDAWAYGAAHGHPPVFSLDGLWFYPSLLANDQLLLPLALLTLAGVAWAVAARRRQAGLILAWLGGGLLLITLMGNKDSRFLFPLLPAFLLCLGGWLQALKPSWLRAGGVSLALLAAALSLAGAGFGLGPLAQDREFKWGPLRLVLSAGRTEYLRPPDNSDWRLGDILGRAVGSRPGAGPVRLGVLASLPTYHKSAFQAVAEAAGVPLEVISVLEPGRWRPGQAAADFWEEVGKADFLALKTGDLGSEPDYYLARDMLAAGDPGGRRRLEPAGQWVLPDGGAARLMRVVREK
ncbi:hypothetical protein AAU61_00280 [Desulfocarbo indianensis]|nr:hypothetical protein AAU61_00280 [Desulfocarbo indianensis]